MIPNILHFHDVDPVLFRRLQITFGLASIVAIVMELTVGAPYGWSLGSDWLSSCSYAIMFVLSTIGWACLVPAASGMAKQSVGLPSLLILLWLACGAMGVASVVGSMMDSGETRRIEAGSAGVDLDDATQRETEAQLTISRLMAAATPSVKAAETSVSAAQGKVDGLTAVRDSLDEKKFANQRGLKTLEIVAAQNALADATQILSNAQDLEEAKANKKAALADIKKARKKAADDKGGLAASSQKRMGDESWFRWGRAGILLAMSFLCPLIFFATREAAIEAEESTPDGKPKPAPEPKPKGNPTKSLADKAREEIQKMLEGAKGNKKPLPERKPQAA